MKKSVAITTIITIHAAIIGVLLIQAGCSTNEEATKVPAAETSAEEVTTIKSDNTVVAEPVKVQEGNPNLRAAPTKPAYSLTPSVQETADENVKPSLNDEEVVAPMKKASKQEQVEEKDATVYVVKKGDSISKIAAKHKVSSAKILSLNSIKNANSIRIGQKLKIPATTAKTEAESENTEVAKQDKDVTVYVVKKGDSISKIAYRNNMTTAQLMKINNLKNANIRIGQKLNVKKIEGQNATKETSKEATSSLKAGEVSHKVRAGEYLGAIAERYSVKIADIKKRNNISDPRKLRVGQTIIIPASANKKNDASATVAKPQTQTAPVAPKAEKPAETKAQPEPVAPVVVPEQTRPVAPAVQPAAPKAEENVPVTTIL